MRTIRLRSPSKINLHLRVAGPDASGFHALRTWFVTTDLCDELTCAIGDGAGGVAMACDDASIPTDGRNLVVRAATAYLGAANAAASTTFELTKRVPAGAGLGGGSANAAATLVALDALMSGHVGRPDVRAIAATLGSDMPFFLGPASAVGTGRGEVLTPAPPPAAAFALLMFPPFGVSTPAAYRMLDQLRPVAPADVLEPFDVDAWSRLDALALSSRLVNDLEPAAFAIEPRLAALRDHAEATLGRPVRMSGSGSTLFALFDDATGTGAASDQLAAGLPELRSVATRLGVARIGDDLSQRIL